MQPRLLIVDDHLRTRERLAIAAKAAGFEVVGKLTTAEEALLRHEALAADVVIADLHLPGDLDGFGLIRRLHELHPEALMVASSSFTGRGSLEQAFEAGAHRCLRKPLRSDTIERLLESLREEIAVKL